MPANTTSESDKATSPSNDDVESITVSNEAPSDMVHSTAASVIEPAPIVSSGSTLAAEATVAVALASAGVPTPKKRHITRTMSDEEVEVGRLWYVLGNSVKLGKDAGVYRVRSCSERMEPSPMLKSRKPWSRRSTTMMALTKLETKMA